jgi:excisionase family DNA binding protein
MFVGRWFSDPAVLGLRGPPPKPCGNLKRSSRRWARGDTQRGVDRSVAYYIHVRNYSLTLAGTRVQLWFRKRKGSATSMTGWITVAEAADALGVTSRQVRNLVEAGALPARRLSSGWVLPQAAVHERARHAPSPGRPLSAPMAWAVLHVAQVLLGDRPASPLQTADSLAMIPDRRMRHRLRLLLAEPRSPQQWEHWLAGRAQRRRIWVHPGALERLAADPRLRPGGGFAAAHHGAGISAGPPRLFYVDAGDVDAVLAKYRAQEDPEGAVELMVIPPDVPELLSVPAGAPVPMAVALIDMLVSPDARERHFAEQRVRPLTLGVLRD